MNIICLGHSCFVVESAGWRVVLDPYYVETYPALHIEADEALCSHGHRDHAATMEEVYALFPRLKERRKQAAGTMSGGERQMLAVGRALMAKPRLLMLDEPSLGLAPLIVKEVLQVVASLRNHGVSVLLVEQNARAALKVADRAYVLEMGSVALSGKASDLLGDKRIIETYLGIGNKTAVEVA